MAISAIAPVQLGVIATAPVLQYGPVTASGAPASAGGDAIGFAQTAAAVGQRMQVTTVGTSVAIAAGPIAVGDYVQVAAVAGRVSSGASGASIGRAFTAAGAAGDPFEVMVFSAASLSAAQAAAVASILKSPTATAAALAAGSSSLANIGSQWVAADYTNLSGGATVSIVTRNGRQALQITTAAGVTGGMDINTIGDVAWFGRMQVEVEGSKAAQNVNNITLLATPDNFTNYAGCAFGTQTNPVNNPNEQGGLYTFRIDGQVTSGATAYQFTGTGPAWGATNPATDGTVTVNKLRFRVVPVSGQVATVWLYGISTSPKRKNGRVFVSFDDGYKSAVQLGMPAFHSRGIPVTLGVIPNLMNDRVSALNYATWDDCRQVLAAGGQVVPHGPMVGGGAGSLISQYTNTADRVADMVASRAMILANGCDSPNYDKVYVWPQGAAQTATGDLSLFDAALAAGFTVGRGATEVIAQQYDFSALSKYQRMLLPIIGHSYGGGGEAANITNITTAINNAAASRSDLILMLHKVVKNADTPDAIGITVGNLNTIADAIATAVAAGTLKAGVLGDLAESTAWAA
jgi:Uncharacterized conserved protein (DUF2190)